MSTIIDTLVTNRTSGYYNLEDLNRVGAAVVYVRNRLISAGVSIAVAPKTDWSLPDIPTIAQMEQYRLDISAIRTVISNDTAVPTPPKSMEKLTAEEANDIEKILLDADAMLTRLISAYQHCGPLRAGQGGLRI